MQYYICKAATIFLFSLITINAWAANKLLCQQNFEGKQKSGAIEKIIIIDNQLSLNVKIDTGATIASLSAINIKTYQFNKKLWVRFEIDLPSTKQKFILDKPVLRYMSILKRKEEISNPLQANITTRSLRPVIELPICIGNQVKKISVNLADRSDFHYPMLLGKDALKQFHIVVDVAEKYLIPPSCSEFHNGE
ncbi:hypothetical protein BH10PSE19_BH10PSE19_11320 [soil metagenome]